METGQVIGGKYRLRKKIGEGGMGSVWSAVHETLDRTVAIKFLQPSGTDTDTAAARFVAEAKSAARVKHRFVVDVFDFGITELGEYYMVQELLEGEELADSIMHGAAWEAADVLRFMAQCLTGLEAVHQAGIIHRDLKPENIFVMRDSDGRFPKLVDFGISKSSDPSKLPRSSAPTRGGRQRQLTVQGTTVGTPWYMSPEQLRGRRDLDARSDLYSMGVILYEWLTGEVPYAEDNLAELALKIAAGSAPPLVSLRPELGHELSSVVARAMAPEPEGRFASAAEMREALTAAIPKLPQAWSVVQKGAKPHTHMANTQAAPRGAKTEALLAAAASSFGESDPSARSKRAVRGALLALGAVTLASLMALPWFREARPERASAHATPVASGAAAPSARSPAGLERVEPPTEPERPALATQPTSGSDAEKRAQDAPSSGPSAALSAAQTRGSARTDEPSDTPRRSKTKSSGERKTRGATSKTLIHNLDF